MTPDATHASWWDRVGLVLVAVTAIAMLAIAAPAADASRLHISALRDMFNDQAGYVAMARGLAETGHLRPHCLFTSAVWRFPDIKDHHLYHPGHYAVLAAAYRLLGYGVWQTYLCGVLGYVLTAMLTYAMARRIGGPAGGVLAALLWMSFPPNLIFAYSAMTEATLSLAAALSLWALLALPDRWRAPAGPLLLLIPFLVRETGALLILPMAAIVVYGERGQRLGAASPGAGRPALWRGVLLGVAAIVLCVAVGRSSLCQPRVTAGPINPGNLIDGTEATMYNDAARQHELSQVPLAAYWRNIAWIHQRNWEVFRARVTRSIPEVVQDIPERELREVLWFLALALACVAVSLRRRIVIGLGISATILLMTAPIVFVYEIFHMRGLRMVLFMLPAICATLGIAAAPLLHGRRGRLVFGVLSLALLGACQIHLRQACAERPASDRLDDRNVAFVEGLGHDDRTLLVAPYRMFMAYEVRHYPVDVAFVPANRETLAWMAQRNRIGTVLLPDPPAPGITLRPADLQAAGLHALGPRTVGRRRYLVFQAPR